MTSTFILGHGEEFVQCPYNTAHQITLITHLEKCRRNYLKTLTFEGQKKDMKICRYNATHHYPSPEIKFHEERCRDAFSVVRHMAYHNSTEGNKKYEERRTQQPDHSDHKNAESKSNNGHSTQSSNVDVKPVAANAWGVDEEDWESDALGYTPGYDPEHKLKKEVIIYNPSGLSKSERKKFRLEIRDKAAEYSVTGEISDELPTASNFDVKPDLKDLYLQDEDINRTSPEKVSSSNKPSSAHAGSSKSTSHDDNYQSSASFNNSQSKQGYSSNWAKTGSHTQRVYATEGNQFSDDDFAGDDPFA